MASIDKIYGTVAQWDELYDFLLTHKPKATKYMGHKGNEDEVIIAVFPEEIDTWLLENCKIVWVVDRIKCQYGIGQ